MPRATRTFSRASHASSRRASAVRAGPTSVEGRRQGEQHPDPVGHGPGVALPEAGVMEPRDERSREPQLVVPGQARGRHIRARGEGAHPAERQPRQERGPIVAIESGLAVRFAAAASASAASAASMSLPFAALASAAEAAMPAKARSVRTRISEASTAGSPSTPVAAAAASRKAVSRRSSSSCCAGVATPSMTATVRPSANSARNGTWSGSSWTSRSASSSEGTPGSRESRCRAGPTARRPRP